MVMLQTIAWISLCVAVLCAVVIMMHEIRHPQTMMVMNFVWPITALYLSVFGLWMYLRFGSKMAAGYEGMDSMHGGHRGSMGGDEREVKTPSVSEAMVSATHCGAGCTLGDIVTEWAIFATGATILGSMLWASLVWDFVAAWTLGIAFQYFTIKPMGQLSAVQALVAAIKADTLSIIAFQVGMYGWMLLVHLRLFAEQHLQANEAVYWLMMQIAMVCGFLTSIPMNWWLLKMGWKESMGA
jgi:hypothetical protein